MEQYISKSALVAEIENLLDKGRYHEEYDCAYRDGNNGALYALKSKLASLEVKEVDLDIEKRIKECPFRQVVCNRYEDTPVLCDSRCSWVADYPKLKELKAQKGEGV